MKNRIATRKLKRMFLQHSQDSFGMKNLVTTTILPLDSIMMEILVSLQIHRVNSVKLRLFFWCYESTWSKISVTNPLLLGYLHL